jgi:hypothetical protein
MDVAAERKLPLIRRDRPHSIRFRKRSTIIGSIGSVASGYRQVDRDIVEAIAC